MKRRPADIKAPGRAIGAKPKGAKASDANIQDTRIVGADGKEYDAIRCPNCRGAGCDMCNGLGFTKQYTIPELLP